MNNLTCILLAAGNSSRLGTPKQLIKFNDDYLINHILRIIEESVCEKVVVVLGSSAYEISRIIKSTKSIIVSNPDWEKGIGTSIKVGLDYAVQNSPGVDAVIFLVCDQYRLKSETIDKIIQKSREHPDKIIASSYAGTIGIPALFVEKYFDEIMNIPDNEGCKEIMHAHINEVIAVDFHGGDSDIDEADDLEGLEKF